MLNIIVILLIIFWLGGFFLDVAGDLIHFILVLALIVFALRFFKRNV